MKRETVERHIYFLKFSHSADRMPFDGEVKWFVDELGARWIKFKERDGDITNTIVIPAKLLLEVVYEPRPIAPSS